MIICSKDIQVRDAIANNEIEIGIHLVDNATNALVGEFVAGFSGALLSQQKNTTPGMQAILQENGYKYRETKFIFFHGQVMVYEKPATQTNEPSITKADTAEVFSDVKYSHIDDLN